MTPFIYINSSTSGENGQKFKMPINYNQIEYIRPYGKDYCTLFFISGMKITACCSVDEFLKLIPQTEK